MLLLSCEQSASFICDNICSVDFSVFLKYWGSWHPYAQESMHILAQWQEGRTCSHYGEKLSRRFEINKVFLNRIGIRSKIFKGFFFSISYSLTFLFTQNNKSKLNKKHQTRSSWTVASGQILRNYFHQYKQIFEKSLQGKDRRMAYFAMENGIF